MPVTELLPLTALVLGITLSGMYVCLWAAKKSGVKPVSCYEKLFFDNCTFVRDTRTSPGHRSYYRSRKGGTVSVEVIHDRGSMVLEFYTEDGRVLQSWRNGDPAAFLVELPPKVRVYWRADMNHFCGSIILR